MRHTTVRLFIVAVVASASVPAAAGAPAVDLTSLADPAHAAASATALLRPVRAADPTATLATAFALGGIDATPAAVPAGAGRAGFPEAIRPLVAAIEQAETARATAVARLTPRERRAIAERPFRSVAAVPERMRTGSAIGNRLELRPAVRAMANRVDLDALARAAVSLVAAVERTAPLLADTLPRGKAFASICPGVTGMVLFETPDCEYIVGGTGDNAYDDPLDPTLLIDPSGDDVYRIDAAAATLEVELVLDLLGNDTYERTASFDAPGEGETLFAQASGALGVGVLADLAGTDSYRIEMTATAPEPGPAARDLGPVGQGASVLGAGVLLDAGGSDRYVITGTSSGGSVTPIGQGGAIGAAALLDLGLEGDDYHLLATSTLHETVSPEPNLRSFTIGFTGDTGQGAGILGVGALADTAGDDVLLADTTGAESGVVAQGGGTGGVGVLLDGGGDDHTFARALSDVRLGLVTTSEDFCWDVRAGAGTSGARAIGHGGAMIGAGVLVDGAGNDTRVLEGSNRTEVFAETASRHACPGGNKAEVTAAAGPGEAFGQGATFTGAGILVDAGGSDSYTLVGRTEAIASATMTSPGADLATVTATAADGRAYGQGFNDVGAALLLDVGGDDTYHVTTGTTATESETIDGVTTAGSSTGPGDERLHGWSESILLSWFVDLQGDDTYSSSSGASAADDDSCWNNNPSGEDGRGRDLSLGTIPSGCP